MDKVQLTSPPYSECDTDRKSCSSKTILVVYSAIASTLFVAVLLFGGIYYSTHLSACKQSGANVPGLTTNLQMHEEFYHRGGDDVRQQVGVDPHRQVEVIRYTSKTQASNGTVIVLDYSRSLTAMFVPAAGECYLIGGIDRKISSPFQNEQAAAEESDDEESINYVKAEDYPVVDHTMLPEDLQSLCASHDVYWLERHTEDHDNREKRSFCGYACYYRNGIRVCVRYCN